jgi:hypothetical protein
MKLQKKTVRIAGQRDNFASNKRQTESGLLLGKLMTMMELQWS